MVEETLTCSEGPECRASGFVLGEESSEAAWSARLFLKRQAWIWGQRILARRVWQQRDMAQMYLQGEAADLMHCTCCQFWAAALCLGHVTQRQWHGL